ncbi:MAG: transglycosylase, partial [Proteobacteria bacterium]|nr:transglycosylase [Pseudomonadota bacterium]
MHRGLLWAAAAVAMIAVGHAGSASASEAPGLPAFKPLPPADFAARREVPPGLHVLSPVDIERYRRVFALQDAGRWQEADHEIRRINDQILMGHVQFQRYMHPTKYRSRFTELSAWMKQYRDHPGSEQVYKLSLKRKPKNYRTPPGPSVSKIAEEEDDEGEIVETYLPREQVYRSPVKRSRAARQKIRSEQRHIRAHLRRGQLTGAVKHLTGTTMVNLFDPVEFDGIRARIAASYFLQGRDEDALRLASAAADRSRDIVTLADWTAGLAAWRLGRYEEARRHFEFLAASSTASDWNIAGGAYWAARANLVGGRPEAVNPWLALGARYRHTFYGLISARLLGKRAEFQWDRPPLDPGTMARLLANPAVQRAVALTEVGQHHLAEREIRRLQPGLNRTSAEALLALTIRLGLPAAEMKLARTTLDPSSPYYAAAAYPVPRWTPSKGYTVDRALVFAF